MILFNLFSAVRLSSSLQCYSCEALLEGDCADGYGTPDGHLLDCDPGVTGCKKTKFGTGAIQIG